MISEIKNILGFVVFEFSDQEITLAEIIFLPGILVFAWIAFRWLTKRLVLKLIDNGVEADLIHLVRRLLYVLAIVVLVITTLDYLNVPITAFAFVSGAIAIGFGFGAQNIINNFISGWILMWERPIRIADFLEVDGAKGVVEAINTRSTRIKRVDGVHLLIPNSKLLENTVVNWTLVDRLIRTTVKVGVAYGSSPCLVSDLILQSVAEQPDILSSPAPVVIFDDFGDNALVFEVYFWVNATAERDLRVIRSNIRFNIDELFTQNDVVIAFPQRDIHIDGSLSLTRSSAPITKL